MPTSTSRQLNTRVQLKHDIEQHWTTAGKAANPFIPKPGEVIIYDPDSNYSEPRFKVGDGSTAVHLLPFSTTFVDDTELANMLKEVFI